MPSATDAHLTILIVEHSATDAELVEQALRSAKIRFSMRTATSGNDALTVLQQRSEAGEAALDLMLLDLSLPDMDGLDLLDQTQDHPALEQTVIVALTGSRDPALIHMARERGVHALMNKPLNVAHLISVMNEQGFWVELKR